MILFLILVTKINLSLWTNKPDHHVESVHVRSLFLVRIFSHIWTEYGDLQIKSPHSLRMWRNMGQTNPECKHFSRSWRQNIVINTHTHVHNTYIHTCNHETTMCLPTYHHSGFMATHALRHMICCIHTRHIVFMIACILCPSCFCEIVRFVHSICLGSLINIKTKINTYDITYISQLSNKRSWSQNNVTV